MGTILGLTQEGKGSRPRRKSGRYEGNVSRTEQRQQHAERPPSEGTRLAQVESIWRFFQPAASE
jgi:hypothetical protein